MPGVNKKLIIIGASGHGKVVADIAMLMGFADIVFLDDNENITSCGKYPVIGKTNDLPFCRNRKCKDTRGFNE